MSLPNLLIVGAAKSGTTSLHEYLKQHPDIFMSKHKEPHFLINNEIGEKRIHKGVLEMEDYLKLFSSAKNFMYRGESSVMYLLFPEITISNIKKYLGDNIKIIIMLRNPIDRAFSGYLHNIRYNTNEDLPFEEAIHIAENRYKQIKHMTPATRYLELGLYYRKVKKFKESFQDVHIILYDDYMRDIDSCLKKIFDFLNVKRVKLDTSKRHMVGGWEWKNYFMRRILIPKNYFKSVVKFFFPKQALRTKIKNILIQLSTKKQSELNLKTRKFLIDFYTKDIEDLSSYLKIDLRYWLK